MDAVVAISRDVLVLSPLNIYESCGDEDDRTFWLTIDGLSRPGFDYKRTYVPDSAWVSGKKLLVSEHEAATLPLNFIVSGLSHDDLSAKMGELEEATSQLFYTVSLTIDGQTTTWDADSTLPRWGTVEYLLQDLMKVRGSLEIPIYD